MSFKSALIYDMDYITKEIDDIETEELIEISKAITKCYHLLINEVRYRESLKSKF